MHTFGGPHNLPHMPNSFTAISIAANEVRITLLSHQFFAAKDDCCCAAAIEIAAGKLFGIWSRLLDPPKTTYLRQKDTKTSSIILMV